MIILDSTTESLEILLAGAVTTNQLPFTASYADHNATAPSFTPGSSDGQTNNTTAVTLVGNPGAGVQRQVKRLNVYNADTAQATVTIRLNNGGTLRTQFSIVLQTGERIEYEDGKGFSVYTVTGAQKVTAVQSTVEPGYIDGMTMQWVSGTSLTVTSGTCYIPSVGSNVNFPAAINKAGLALSASTFYHVYAFLNSGVPDIEIVTTAPSSPYNGSARTKTGDTTRRYIGSVLTDGSSAIFNFMQPEENRVIYRTPSGAAPQAVLSTGVATVATSVSCALVVPTTATTATITFINNANAGSNMRVLESLGTYGATGSLYGVTAGVAISADMPLNASQQFQYYMTTAPSAGGGNAQVTGYTFGR